MALQENEYECFVIDCGVCKVTPTTGNYPATFRGGGPKLQARLQVLQELHDAVWKLLDDATDKVKSIGVDC